MQETTQGRAPVLTFIGGAGTVTGSKSLIETTGGRVLVDCGLFQGRKHLRLQNWDPFPVPPESIDAVLLTHAHIDHCGYLPRLARWGFRGPVYCTSGTAELAGIVLPDSGHLHEEEATYANRRGYSKHEPALPLYTRQDAIDCLGQLVPVSFDAPIPVLADVDTTWRRAGHILGAASIHLQLSGCDQHVVFSGDLGRSTHPLLLPPADIGAADVVITESTYGDENHPEGDPDDVIADVVAGAARHGGVVIIPASRWIAPRWSCGTSIASSQGDRFPTSRSSSTVRWRCEPSASTSERSPPGLPRSVPSSIEPSCSRRSS